MKSHSSSRSNGTMRRPLIETTCTETKGIMSTLTSLSPKNSLAIFCPLITLIPVLLFLWSTPAESQLTLTAWFMCNLIMQGFVQLISRQERRSMTRAT